jgi:ABC-type glycerol-3-phosphate transport system permease component
MNRTSSRDMSPASRTFIYGVLILAFIVSIFPFVWMATTAFKTRGDAIVGGFWPWPPLGNSAPIITNFAEALRTQGIDQVGLAPFLPPGLPLFFRQLLNSLIIAAINVTGVVVISTMAAYAFANLNFPGKNFMFILVLATQMIPEDLTLVPKVVMMSRTYLGWYNTFAALTIPFLISAFAIFLMRQYLMQLPKDLWDAAQIDGNGHLGYLARVALPLVKPALVTIALLEFIYSWNEFKWAQLVTRDSDMRNLTVGLYGFVNGEGGTQVELAMAMALMTVAPIVILYLLTQRTFTEGITTSGLKG